MGIKGLFVLLPISLLSLVCHGMYCVGADGLVDQTVGAMGPADLMNDVVPERLDLVGGS